MIPRPAPELEQIPPYLFVRLNAVRAEAEAAGKDIIDLGMGNPDLPTPPRIVSALCRSVQEDPSTHRYPQTRGTAALRRAIAAWYEKRFQVSLDPEIEVLPLVGSKEGLAHLFDVYLGPKDCALVPSPCYPVHLNGVLLSGAKASLMPLREDNGFLPDLSAVPAADAKRAKILLLNYPNNPTGATLPDTGLFQEALRWASRRSCIVVHDNAYSELSFDGYRAPSFLQVPGAKEAGVEFHSCSKSYSMAGWRVGFVAGNAQVIANLSKFKSFLDYGIPGFIQAAAVEALTGPQDSVAELCRVYQARRDVLAGALTDNGWPVARPKASMYLWARLPKAAGDTGSLAFAEDMIRKTGVVVAPGVGFGPFGEGFVRFALVDSEDRLKDAARRIASHLASLTRAAGAGPTKADALGGRPR